MTSLPAVILKTVLFIFLALIIVILAFLFVPLRYRFRFACGNGETREKLAADLLTKETDADIRISWLLRIFGLTFSKSAGKAMLVRMRILCFSYPLKKKAKRRRKKKLSGSGQKKEKQKPGLKKRLSQFADACGKMDDVSLGRLLRNASGRAGRFIRQILPKKAFLEGVIGTGDPAATGRVFMFLGILEGLDGSRIHFGIEPDLESARCRLNGSGNGNLFLFRVVQILLWAVLDKDIRAVRRALKKQDKHAVKAKEAAAEDAAQG